LFIVPATLLFRASSSTKQHQSNFKTLRYQRNLTSTHTHTPTPQNFLLNTILPTMVVWDDTKDKQLLLILIDLTPEEQAGKKWEVVAAKMGEGYTGEAIR
jgi:hypothetical protein